MTGVEHLSHWGSNGHRVWWPAGLERLAPIERVTALDRGWWLDGGDLITRDGRRLTRVDSEATPFVPTMLDPTRIRVEAVAVDGLTAVERETIA